MLHVMHATLIDGYPQVSAVHAEFHGGKIASDRLRDTADSMKATQRFFKAIENGKALKMHAKWVVALEKLEQVSSSISASLIQSGFSDEITRVKAEDLFAPEKRKAFVENLMEMLRVSDEQSTYPKNVLDTAVALLPGTSTLSCEKGHGIFGNIARDLLPVFAKVLVLVPAGDQAPFSAIHRLLGTAQQARDALAVYQGLAGDGTARVKQDLNGDQILGLSSMSKTLEAQLRQCRPDMVPKNMVDDFVVKIGKVLETDGPEHYTVAKQVAADMLDKVLDPEAVPPRSLKDCYGGTYDGSDWHKLVGKDCNFKSLYAEASKTILTLDPVLFKKQALALEKQIESVKRTREKFDVESDQQWESKHAGIVLKALVTAKEATIVGVLHRFSADNQKNSVQSKCRSEKNSAIRAKPNQWEPVHATVKNM